jgi:hypothetical protein
VGVDRAHHLLATVTEAHSGAGIEGEQLQPLPERLALEVLIRISFRWSHGPEPAIPPPFIFGEGSHGLAAGDTEDLWVVRRYHGRP